MRRPYRKLNLNERRILATMLQAKATKTKIAETLGRDRSTIHREIKRNWWHDTEVPQADGYWHLTAQTLADRRHLKRRKLERHEDLRSQSVRGNRATPARLVVRFSPWKQAFTTARSSRKRFACPPLSSGSKWPVVGIRICHTCKTKRYLSRATAIPIKLPALPQEWVSGIGIFGQTKSSSLPLRERFRVFRKMSQQLPPQCAR